MFWLGVRGITWGREVCPAGGATWLDVQSCHRFPSSQIQHLRQVFRANGYLEPVVKNNLRGRPTPSNTIMESEMPPELLHLPYVKGVSEQIEKMCRPLGVKTVMKTADTHRSRVVKAKQAMPNSTKKGVIYIIPCKDCPCVYIGETGRTLEK